MDLFLKLFFAIVLTFQIRYIFTLEYEHKSTYLLVFNYYIKMII